MRGFGVGGSELRVMGSRGFGFGVLKSWVLGGLHVRQHGWVFPRCTPSTLNPEP